MLFQLEIIGHRLQNCENEKKFCTVQNNYWWGSKICTCIKHRKFICFPKINTEIITKNKHEKKSGIKTNKKKEHSK